LVVSDPQNRLKLDLVTSVTRQYYKIGFGDPKLDRSPPSRNFTNVLSAAFLRDFFTSFWRSSMLILKLNQHNKLCLLLSKFHAQGKLKITKLMWKNICKVFKSVHKIVKLIFLRREMMLIWWKLKCTVKSVQNSHPQDSKIVVVVNR